MVEQGGFINHEIFSYTAQRAYLGSHSQLAQVLLYLVWVLGGVNGLVLLVGLIFFIALSFNLGGYVDYLMAEKALYLAALAPSFLVAVLVLRSRHYQWIALVLLLVLVGY